MDLKQNTTEKGQEDGREETQEPSMVFVTIGYSLKSGKMAYANPHTETEEGRAFLLLCNQKIMKKRDFQRYTALSRRAKR